MRLLQPLQLMPQPRQLSVRGRQLSTRLALCIRRSGRSCLRSRQLLGSCLGVPGWRGDAASAALCLRLHAIMHHLMWKV
jgi:hypothetical protein